MQNEGGVRGHNELALDGCALYEELPMSRSIIALGDCLCTERLADF